jgi:hypothetical protein
MATPTPCGPQRVDARADGRLALRHGLVVDQSDLAARLCLHHAHQIRICHRRERVVLHAGFVEQHLADEQVALEDGAPVVGEGGRGDAEVGLQRVHQRLGHRADVALRRAVEGGAVLEVDLLRALRLQPGQRAERLGDGVGDRRDVRDFSATTTASTSASRGPSGTPMVCTTRMPARTRLLARSVAPVKSSAMQPRRWWFHGFLLGSSMPGKILITALSSSFASPRSRPA